MDALFFKSIKLKIPTFPYIYFVLYHIIFMFCFISYVYMNISSLNTNNNQIGKKKCRYMKIKL